MIDQYAQLLNYAALWCIFSYFVGGVDVPLESLGVLIVLDIITGLLGAIKERNLEARKLTSGILHKILLIFTVGVSVLIDHTTSDAFHLRTFTLGLLGAGEGLSICENLIKMGYRDVIPHALLTHLKSTLKKRDEEEP